MQITNTRTILLNLPIVRLIFMISEIPLVGFFGEDVLSSNESNVTQESIFITRVPAVKNRNYP